MNNSRGGDKIMRCTSCGHQLVGSKVCPSCGYDHRLKKIEAVSNDTTKDDLILRTWLWILFWLIIPSTIGNLMTKTKSSSWILAGSILVGLTSLAYCLILLRLSTVEKDYRKAGIFYLIIVGVSALSGLGGTTLTAILALPLAIVSLLSQYFEMSSHAYVLTGVDINLSDAWTLLWKWTIGVYCGLLAGVILVVLIPILGLIVTLVALIGLLIVSIVKLVLLFRTARSF